MFTQKFQNNQGNGNDNNEINGGDMVPVTYVYTIPVVDFDNCVKTGHIYLNYNKTDRRRNRNVNILHIGYIFMQHNDRYFIKKIES